jgi:hypothetical protein
MFDIQSHEYALNLERRQKLLREAKMQQLWNKVDEERPQFGERLMALVGDLMISGGQKLKERSGAAQQYAAEAQPTLQAQ